MKHGITINLQMAEEMDKVKNFNVEAGKDDDILFDDDGHPKRTGFFSPNFLVAITQCEASFIVP